jgi:hypothetical protein
MKNVTQYIKLYEHLKGFYDAMLRPHFNITLCTFPIFTVFPTAFLHLINYSNVIHSSTINSKHQSSMIIFAVQVNTY